MKCKRYLINVKGCFLNNYYVIIAVGTKEADKLLNDINKCINNAIKVVRVKGSKPINCECTRDLTEQVDFFVKSYKQGCIKIVPESEVL